MSGSSKKNVCRDITARKNGFYKMIFLPGSVQVKFDVIKDIFQGVEQFVHFGQIPVGDVFLNGMKCLCQLMFVIEQHLSERGTVVPIEKHVDFLGQLIQRRVAVHEIRVLK